MKNGRRKRRAADRQMADRFEAAARAFNALPDEERQHRVAEA